MGGAACQVTLPSFPSDPRLRKQIQQLLPVSPPQDTVSTTVSSQSQLVILAGWAQDFPGGSPVSPFTPPGRIQGGPPVFPLVLVAPGLQRVLQDDQINPHASSRSSASLVGHFPSSCGTLGSPSPLPCWKGSPSGVYRLPGVGAEEGPCTGRTCEWAVEGPFCWLPGVAHSRAVGRRTQLLPA